MENILFINSCIRKNESRTLALAKALLDKLEGEIKEVDLTSENIAPLTAETLALRNELTEKGDLSHPMLKYASDFAAADTIVIGTPFWDLAFPAVLKQYLEQICACGITFRYNDHGIPQGMCKAKKVYYVTTAGGFLEGMNFGFDYIKALCNLYFGIKDVECIAAEGLDIWGNDAEKILEDRINSL
ncbi:MAG: NAD(P)H-dependent oxidoreductase [Firmicutes bacterium]|nr:NAD(P)H-dependent oxidoreductase [Bacillota bacterium]